HPERRMRLLERLGNYRDRPRDAPEATVVGKRVLAPHPRDHLYRLAPARARLLRQHPEPQHLVHRGRAPGAEFDATVGHDIEYRDPLGDADRMVERQHRHAMPDPDPAGALTDTSQED